MNAFAAEHVNHDDYSAALEIYLQILDLNIKYYGSESPSVAATHHNIGVVYAKEASAVGSVEPVDQPKKRECERKALLNFQNAARIARNSLSADHPNVAVSLMRVGYLLLLKNQYNSALTTFQEALRIRLEHYGRKNSLVAKVYNNLGVVHLQLSNFAEGKVNFQRALDIHRSILTTAYKAEGVRDTAGEIARARMDVSDTLCNIGSLCLDWIEKQGEQTTGRSFEHNRALEAESAFAEALAVRLFFTMIAMYNKKIRLLSDHYIVRLICL
jgi:tetratricopeptide (TPR) repeat protein